jgi:DNA-binding transcriptional MerR regulator
MRRGKLAKILGVDPNTITDWASREQFSKFLSEEAKGESDLNQRDFNENDVLVLNTIRIGRARDETWEDIGARLQRGERDTDLPPSALTVDTAAPIAQYAKIQVYEAKIDALEDQIEDMRYQHRQEIERLEKARTDEREQLVQQIRNLERSMGKLETLLEIEKQQNEDKGGGSN